MGNELNTSAGGLHPGRPVIWPTSKNKSQSSSTQQTQESSKESAKSSSSSSASSSSSQTATQSASQAVQASKAAPTPTPQEIAQAQAATQALMQGQVSKQYSKADLAQLLMSQNVTNNDANQKLATLMLRYGVEVTKGNISQLSSMMAGEQSQTMQEASLLLLMKGIDSPAAAKTLSQFLSDNPQMAAQLLALKGNVSDLLTSLSLAKGLLTPQLISQLAAMLAQFNEELDQVPGKYKFSGKGSMGRSELSNSMRALKSLLDGMPKENLPDSAEGQIIESNINSTKNKLDQMINSVISQAMLSKPSPKSDVNYAYYQIPNPMVKPPTTIELIVKRSESEGGKKINEKDTELIMSLDTENMGRVAIKMTVKDKKVDFIFNTQNEEIKSLIATNTKDLAKALLDKDYMPEKMDVNVNPSMCAIKPFLIPFLGIEDLMRIDISA